MSALSPCSGLSFVGIVPSGCKAEQLITKPEYNAAPLCGAGGLELEVGSWSCGLCL